MEDPTALLADLVRIDSVNPGLEPGRPGEAAIARYVRDWAEARGLQTRWIEPARGRPGVIVRAPGRGGGRTLMWNAHLDTVGVAGMEAPFEPAVRDGRMYGRGTMDMKASLAAALSALQAVAPLGLAGDVVLTAVPDEEEGSVGTMAVAREVSADAAMVLEPTDLDLHVAHRGFTIAEVTLYGKASHTSRPHEGVNAVTHLGRLLAAVEAHDAALRRAEPHPLLGHGALQAVAAEGGRELFTTPDRARAVLERRTLPRERPAAVREEVLALLGELRHADGAVQAEATFPLERAAFETPAETDIVEMLAAACERVTGRTPARRGAPYWTDAALLDEAGVPAVLFGPVGGGIHQPGEWVDLASVDTLRRVLEESARAYCG